MLIKIVSKAGSRGLRVALVAIVDDQIRLKSGVKEESTGQTGVQIYASSSETERLSA
jgi:hypothetical protein